MNDATWAASGSGGEAGTDRAAPESGGSSQSGSGGGAGDGGGGDGMEDGGAGAPGTSDDAGAERTPDDASPSADASCVPEASSAFCLRQNANCGEVTALDNCGSTVTFSCGVCASTQLCGAQGPNRCGNPMSLAQGGTVSSSSPNMPPEDMKAAFDGNTQTKWFAGDTTATGWIAYEFAAGASHVVSSYSVTSANDRPGRDPATWKFQGSSDGSAWTTLDARSSQTFANRFQTNTYNCASMGAYSRYRLNITANGGEPALQLAEIQLFGY